MAKKFMYVCIGVLALMVAYHLGAASATSQPTGQAMLFTGGWDLRLYVMTDTGEIWHLPGRGSDWDYWATWPGTPPTTTEPSTWGKIKAKWQENE